MMETPGKRQRKQLDARHWLRSRLLMLSPGESLPGIREMSRLCGAGRTVLEHILAEAEREGLLVRQPRVGFFRTERPATDRIEYIIALDDSYEQLEPVGSHQQVSYISRTALRLRELAAAAGNRVLFSIGLKKLPPGIPQFLLGPRDPAQIARLEDSSPRTVIVSGRGGRLSVRPPGPQSSEIGLNCLYHLGHRKIGFFYHREQSGGLSPHLFAYYKFMAEHGIRSYPHFLIPYPAVSALEDAIRKMLRHPVRPDAILAPGCWMPDIYRVLHEEKILVPWHISILSIGVPPPNFREKPEPGIVYDSPEKLAETAWEVMHSQEQSGAFRLEPQLRFGKSIRSRL